MPGASPWPPPPVTEKGYEPVVGTLLWSKFNGDRRLAGPTVEEQMSGLGDLIDLMVTASADEFSAAASEAAAARIAANKPKKKKKDPAAPSPIIAGLVDKSQGV